MNGAPKAAASAQPKATKASTKATKEKKVKTTKTDAKALSKRKLHKQKLELQKQQPASQFKTEAKQLAVASRQLQVPPLPTADELHTKYAAQSTQSFKKSPFHYHQVPRHHADMILMGDTAGRRHEEEMIQYVDSPLLMVTDPVLRETLRQEENKALKFEHQKNAKIHQHILSTLSSNDKIKAMIKEGASNKTVLNAMYNLLPRIMPTRRLRHNIDSLDWLGVVRHRWQNEVEPNGLDVEDSSDADTLPQQRAFTRDEMNRLLQDVEESKYIESDVEEALFAPAAAIGDLKRELQQLEIQKQLRYVLKNIHGDATTPETFDFKAMRYEFKRLLGRPPRPGTEGTDVKPPEFVTEEQRKHALIANDGDLTPNQLSESLEKAIIEKRHERDAHMGAPTLYGSNSGTMDASDFLLPATLTNPGLGLMPPMFDMLQLPIHYINDTSKRDETIDIYDDTFAPFQSRFDIACAVVLNRVMGPQHTNVPVYLTDTVEGETKLITNPHYKKAQLAMLHDIKSGTQTAVESLQELMSQGYHPQDVMKRLVATLDRHFNESTTPIFKVSFDDQFEITPIDEAAAITFTGDEVKRLRDYHSFVSEAMKVAKVMNVTDKFTKPKPVGVEGFVAPLEPADISQRAGIENDADGSAPHGLLKSSLSKVDFKKHRLQTDADGNFIDITTASSDAHPESMILRAGLQAQEYGIGSVHRISPTEINLSNNLEIETTEPLPSPFGFRPAQKTIYGKQTVGHPQAYEHVTGGLASREVPATRYTTDGTEISLDPHRAREYSRDEMKNALLSYEKYVRPRYLREKVIAEETALIFGGDFPDMSALLRFQQLHDPTIQQRSISELHDMKLNDQMGRLDHKGDIDIVPEDGLLPIKRHLRDKAFQHIKDVVAHKESPVEGSEDFAETDVEIALSNSMPLNIRNIDDLDHATVAPHLALERQELHNKEQNEFENILNSQGYATADVPWAPLTKFDLEHSKFILDRHDKKEISRDVQFRRFCAKINLELTPWESEFNTLIRRVYDGDITEQLTHAARQMTREEQLAALAPIMKDWRRVLVSNRERLLNPKGLSDVGERAFRAKNAAEFTQGIELYRAQAQWNLDVGHALYMHEPGYAATGFGAYAENELESTFKSTHNTPMGIDDHINLKSNVKISLPNDQAPGEVGASGQKVQTGTILAAATVPSGFKKAAHATSQSATKPDVIPHASTTAKLHKPKYTLMDLFEGRVKIAGGGSENDIAITDFDFRKHYMDKIFKDVEEFNNKYYTRQEFTSFDDLVKSLPDGDKLPPEALKVLRAKSQITGNKFLHFKRNDTPYADSDVDPLTGRELKIKSLGVADVDAPLPEQLLSTIQRHHRLMLNELDQPHQFNIDIDAYTAALQSNGGDSVAALEAAEQKADLIPNEALTKQLKRYLQAWRARDIESAAIAEGQGHTNVDLETNAKGETKSVHDLDLEAARWRSLADDIVGRSYSRYLLGLPPMSPSDMKLIDYEDEPGQLPPALRASPELAAMTKRYYKEQHLTDLVDMALDEHGLKPNWFDDNTPEKLAAELEEADKRPSIWDNEDQGLGFRQLHRTPRKQYQATMDLPVDGDEMDHLREKLTKDIFDPEHEKNLDDRVEWFNQPELLDAYDHRTLTDAINKWTTNDPFLQYMDVVPKGIKEGEVLRSSFSMIPPRLLDEAIRSKQGDESAKQGRRRNLLRYNPAFSFSQLRKFRRGLEKYSGIPLYLLDFAEVAYNPHRPFFVHASKEENHLRQMMTEERLRQPAKSLISERPDNSDNDAPDISTPITIGGVPASRQAAHVQNHYKTLHGTERVKRIEQFKKDLTTPLRDELEDLMSDTSEYDDEELQIAQDMFQKALDRMLQRDGSAVLTDDYSLDRLHGEYPSESAHYRRNEAIRKRIEIDKETRSTFRGRLPSGKSAYDDQIVETQHGFAVPIDSENEMETLNRLYDQAVQADPSLKHEDPSENSDDAWEEHNTSKIRNTRRALAGLPPVDFASESEAENATETFGGKFKPAFFNNIDDHRLRDLFTSFYDFIEKSSDPTAGRANNQTIEARIAKLQAQRAMYNIFPQKVIDTIAMSRDPGGLEPNDIADFFDDDKNKELRTKGRERQALIVIIQSYLRHRRAVSLGVKEGTDDPLSWEPHDYELGFTFEHIYGKFYWETDEDRATAREDYLRYVRSVQDVTKQAESTELEEFMEPLQEYEAPVSDAQLRSQAVASGATAQLSKLTIKDVEGQFDPAVAVEAEKEAADVLESPDKPMAPRRVRQRTPLGIDEGDADNASIDALVRSSLPSPQALDTVQQVFTAPPTETALRNSYVANLPYWSAYELYPGEPGDNEGYEDLRTKIFDLTHNGFGIAKHYETLSRKHKIRFLMELIDMRHQRDALAARREDIMATVYGTQRQLLRRLTDELQLVKRAERTAFKRIYALDPDYARQLVGRHLLYATNRQLENDDRAEALQRVNWKTELRYVEEIMWSSANRLNARTGGMFPGTPGVAQAHDKAFFTPPPLVAGEFAPMFIDEHMIDSEDEMEDALTRLRYHGNADFIACGSLQWKEKARKKSTSGQDKENDDTIPSFNTRPHVSDILASEAKMIIREDFSQYEFTSDAEEQLIDHNIAQLRLDAGTNMAFASAIAHHRRRLDARRAEIERDHPLMLGDLVDGVDYQGGHLYASEKSNKLEDGSVRSRYADTRRRLKKLMRSKSELNGNETSPWAGLYGDAHVDFDENGPGDNVHALLDGVNKLLERSQRVAHLSPGNIVRQINEAGGEIALRNGDDAKKFFKDQISKADLQIANANSQFKADVSKKIETALGAAQTAKAKATTDIMGETVVDTIPQKFGKINVKALIDNDPELRQAIIGQQAFQRYMGANTILQSNALTLRLSEAVDDTNHHLVDGIGTDLLSQAAIDNIQYKLFGGKGGASLIPTTDENIESFVSTPEEILGDVLNARPLSGAKRRLHDPHFIYNTGRTTKQEQEDLAKLKAGEYTEWTDFEEFETEDDEKRPVGFVPPHVRFAKAILQRNITTRPKYLHRIDAFDNDYDVDKSAEATHPAIADKQDRPVIDGAFNPIEHITSGILDSVYKLDGPLVKGTKPRLFSQNNPVIAEYPHLKAQFEKMEQKWIEDNGVEVAFEYAPAGVAPHPKPLQIPDNATPSDIEALLVFDDDNIKRPLFQTLRKSARDVLDRQLPSWMKDAKRTSLTVQQHITPEGDLATKLNSAYVQAVPPGHENTVEPIDGVEGGNPVETFRPQGLKSTVSKVLRNRYVSIQEAIELGLDPNTYESTLTKLQKDAIDKHVDNFFNATSFHEDQHFSQSRYLRSLLLFTGLRRLQADPQINSEQFQGMLHGADIENEEALYPDLNLQSFYKYVRGIEKEDKLMRMGLLDKYNQTVTDPTVDIFDPKSNPLIAAKRGNADRYNSPLLDLVRDIVDHSHAYAHVAAGKGAPVTPLPKYNPLPAKPNFNKHRRFEEEYSQNESDFENVNVVTVNEELQTTQSTVPEFNEMHDAMVKTKRSLNGLSIEEVEGIFAAADEQPPLIRQVLIGLLKQYLLAHPQNAAVPQAHHVYNPDLGRANHTAHPLRNALALHANGDDLVTDPANPRGLWTLEEIDLSLVDMTKRFNQEFGSAFPQEDVAAFNKILVDCAREGRVYYPKPKVHEVQLENEGGSPDEGVVGFDTGNLVVGELKQFNPKDLRYSSDTVTLETFNRIMALPVEKLKTFMAYTEYLNIHAKEIAHSSFFKQLNEDIRRVRPVSFDSLGHVADAQRVREMHKNRSQFDQYTMGPGGYLRLGNDRLADDVAIQNLVIRSKYGRVKHKNEITTRSGAGDVSTEDPAYNFRAYETDMDTYDVHTRDIIKDFYHDTYRNIAADQFTDLGIEATDYDDGRYLIEEVVPGDRPADDDLSRRFLNMQQWLSDPLSPRQVKIMKQLYEERLMEAYWQGTTSPFDSAHVYNNLRLADKMIGEDTYMDHDRELARLHREIVVGVVREVMDDQDIHLNSLEFDSYNLEPDFLPQYSHFDHVNVFAARRFSPYTTLPLSESNIPPIIGLEQQRNIYNLHLLDPVTFHPRWLARRLNVSYAQMIAILKTYDFRHRLNMVDVLYSPEANYHDTIDGIDDSPINPDFANTDIQLPNPPEVQLSQMDEEYLYSRFAPNLIGRVSWVKNREREMERTDPGFRNVLGFQEMFGGDGVAKLVDGLESAMTRRFMEEEQILDALEQAAFARFGPITYASSKPFDLHKPPKQPREIISTSLHPPVRNNWALTTLDERNKATYGIMIRDRDGYLRHPTYREFKYIRNREKDPRTPFHWRRHHVMGKLPEISSLFVDQITQIRQDFEAKNNLAKDLRSAADLKFVKQVNYTPVQRMEDIRPGNDSTDQSEDFDKRWNAMRSNTNYQHPDSTIRARDWIGEYDSDSRKLDKLDFISEAEETIKSGRLNQIPLDGGRILTDTVDQIRDTPQVRLLRNRIRAVLKGKENMKDSDNDNEPLLIAELLDEQELAELELPVTAPAQVSDVEQWTPDHEEYFEFANDEQVEACLNAKTDLQRRVAHNAIVMAHLRAKHPKLVQDIVLNSEELSDHPDKTADLKDTITLRNIMRRKAIEQGLPLTPELLDNTNPLDTFHNKEAETSLSRFRKGIKPTEEMFHYQRILSRSQTPSPIGPYYLPSSSEPETTSEDIDSSESNQNAAQIQEAREMDREENENLHGPEVKGLLTKFDPKLAQIYYGMSRDMKPAFKTVRKWNAETSDGELESEGERLMRGATPRGDASSSELLSEDSPVDDNIKQQFLAEESQAVPDSKKPKKNQRKYGLWTGLADLELDRDSPEFIEAEKARTLAETYPYEPNFADTWRIRDPENLPRNLANQRLAHYLSPEEIELERQAINRNRPKAYIASMTPIRVAGKVMVFDADEEALDIVDTFGGKGSNLPIPEEDMRAFLTAVNNPLVPGSEPLHPFAEAIQDLEEIEAQLEKEAQDETLLAQQRRETVPDVSVEESLESLGVDTKLAYFPGLKTRTRSAALPETDTAYLGGVKNRNLSEDGFEDEQFAGADMYQETYGIPRNKLNAVQNSYIKSIRRDLGRIRTNKLQGLAAEAHEYEVSRLDALHEALYDPSQKIIKEGGITRVPTSLHNDAELQQYFDNIKPQNH